MDRNEIAARIRQVENSAANPYTDEQLERALVASQSSDALSITIRAITMLVVYALLARAIVNGVTGASLLLPLVIEMIAMVLVGWLVLRPLIDCGRFRRSVGGIVRNLIFIALMLAAAYGLLKVDSRLVLPDQITAAGMLESLAPLRDDTALLLAIVAAVGGLLASSLSEALQWRSQRRVFIWTSINFLATRLGVLLVLACLSVFVLLPAYAFEWLPNCDSPLVESLSFQQWAWPIWTGLLLLDMGALTALTLMHREAADKHASDIPEKSDPH